MGFEGALVCLDSIILEDFGLELDDFNNPLSTELSSSSVSLSMFSNQSKHRSYNEHEINNASSIIYLSFASVAER